MTCSKAENASWTTDASTPPALANCVPRLAAPPLRAARAAWQIGHHWHSGGSVGGGSLVAVSHTSPLLRRPLHLVGDLIRHAARARLHQPALEVGDGVAPPGPAATRLAAAARLAAGPGPTAAPGLAIGPGLTAGPGLAIGPGLPAGPGLAIGPGLPAGPGLIAGPGLAGFGLIAGPGLIAGFGLVPGPGLVIALRRAAARWLAVALGFRHLTPPTSIVPGYQCRTNGTPVARKCPTFRHSVTPILVLRASGWCTCPKIEYLGRVALIASSNATLPFSRRRATVS